MRAVAVLLVLVAPGCGQTPEEAVRDTVAGYYEALLDRRHDDVCATFTPGQRQRAIDALRDHLSPHKLPSDCEEAVGILAEGGPGEVVTPERWRSPLKRLPSARVRIAGERATVTWPDEKSGFRDPPGPRRLVKHWLLRLDGDWRIAGREEARSWP